MIFLKENYISKFIKIATLFSAVTCVQVAPIIGDFTNTATSNQVLSYEYSGLKPSALFASPIFPLSDSQEGYDISGESNKTSFLNNNKSSLSGGATKYLSIDSVSLASVHTTDKFILYLGYSAAELQDVNNLLWENHNKMSISELLKHDGLFAKKPYFSFLKKAYDLERGSVKIQISGKVTLNCENDSLFDPYFTETYDFTSEFELSNLITNDNYGVSIPSCYINGIPGNFNKGTLNITFSKKDFFDDMYLEYVPLSKDKTIPEHYELSCENKEITLDGASLEMYGKTSNKLQFNKDIPILPANSTDFEFPNFYKIKIDTKDINWREFVDESGKKIKYSKVYDIFDGDSYKDINIPIERFTFFGFDGKALSDGDVQFWLSKNKNPSKKDNLLFYPQDDLNSSEINYVKDKDEKVTDISIRVPINNRNPSTNINWYFSSAQGYSTTCIPTETNDPYTVFDNHKGLILLLNGSGSAYNPTTFNGDPCALKYSLDLKSDDLTTIAGQSTVYHKDEYDFIYGKYHSIEGRINYEINVSGMHFEIHEFNPDSTRRYFELHPEKATNIFSLKDVFDLQDEFCKHLGQFFLMSCNIKFEGSVKFSFLNYVDGKCTSLIPEVEFFDLNDFAISTTNPKESCSFSKEYGPKIFCADYITPIFSINDFDPSTPRTNAIYEMLNFKFECNSAGDYVPRFFYDDFLQQKKIRFNINSNMAHEGACASYTSLPTFSFSNESLFFVPHSW